jgi:hypothetical protein
MDSFKGFEPIDPPELPADPNEGDFSIGGDVSFGSNLDVSGDVSFGSNLDVSGDVSFGSNLIINGSAESTNKDTGSLIVEGGVGIEKNLNVGGDASVSQNLYVSGISTFIGNVDFRGNIIFGDTSGDNVIFNADVNSNIIPNIDNTYDLGSTVQRWRDGYFGGNVILSTEGTATNHAVRADRTISTGDGLSGGGNLTTNRTFAVDSTVVRTSGNQTIGGVKNFSSNMTVGGNLSVTGSLSKGSGSFRISHPLPELSETHDLVHSFIEGPRADLIYRGKVFLVDGVAEVNLDEYIGITSGTWELLCRDPQVFLQNNMGWFLVRGSVLGSILFIESQDKNCNDEIDWCVIAERKDSHMYNTGWTDDNGRPILEPLKFNNDST